MSAARLARDVSTWLTRAFRSSGKTQKQLAKSLDLSEGAVSQVLNGDGNLRIASIGRYPLRALGYEARLQLVPVDPDAKPIAEPRRRARTVAVPSPATVDTPRQSQDWQLLNVGDETFGMHFAWKDGLGDGHRVPRNL